MYPLGHLGTGLIIASMLYMPVGAFIVGVFLPDIFDKTMSIAGLLDCSRSFAHNVFFALGAGGVTFAITRNKKLAIAIALGCTVHLIQDSRNFVPYFYPLVEYDFGQCGEFKIQPGYYEYATEAVGAALIVVWWKYRSKLFYIRDKILRLGRLKRVLG